MKTKFAEPKTRSADKIAGKVAGMSRTQLKWALLSMRSRLRENITGQYLDSLSPDRLRKMLLSAMLEGR